MIIRYKFLPTNLYKKFDEILGELVVKAQGKPTLVPASDKRKAWTNTAEEDFKEEN